MYTAGVKIPKPVATLRYYHRLINPNKLIKIGFSSLPPNTSLKDHLENQSIPDTTKTPGLRKMQIKDSKAVTKLLNKYNSRFDFAPVFSFAQVKHIMIPLDGVIDSFVVEDSTGKISEFISFYHLPSTVLNNPLYSTLNAVYLFYYVPKDDDKESLKRLVTDAMILAKNGGCDVFNCLELMQNMDFLDDLKFAKGDGFLNYYWYNYNCQDVPGDKVGLVML